MQGSLVKSKTFWGAIVQFVVVVISFITGEVSLEVVIYDFVAMLMLIFYRADMGTNLHAILNGYFEKVDFLKDGVFWTVLVGILGSITAWLTGTIDLATMLIAVASALVAFFLRSGNVPETT